MNTTDQYFKNGSDRFNMRLHIGAIKLNQFSELLNGLNRYCKKLYFSILIGLTN